MLVPPLRSRLHGANPSAGFCSRNACSAWLAASTACSAALVAVFLIGFVQDFLAGLLAFIRRFNTLVSVVQTVPKLLDAFLPMNLGHSSLNWVRLWTIQGCIQSGLFRCGICRPRVLNVFVVARISFVVASVSRFFRSHGFSRRLIRFTRFGSLVCCISMGFGFLSRHSSWTGRLSGLHRFHGFLQSLGFGFLSLRFALASCVRFLGLCRLLL